MMPHLLPTPMSKQMFRLLFFSIFVLAIVHILHIAWMGRNDLKTDSAAPKAERGVLDLSGWDFRENRNLELKGEWEFYWRQFLSPEEFKQQKPAGNPSYIRVPGPWNGQEIEDSLLPERGYATYRLIIELNDSSSILALRLKTISNTYRVWINGKEIASAGTVSKAPDAAIPEIKPQIAFCKPDGNTLDLVIQVSNYIDPFGGILDNITLGSGEKIVKAISLRIAFEMFITGVLIITTCHHLGLYFLRRKDPATLYFALICILWAVNYFSCDESRNLIYQWINDYECFYKLIYISLFSLVPLFSLFFRSLFPNEFHRYPVIVSFVFFVGLDAIILITPLLFYNQYLFIGYIVSLLLLGYLVYALVLGIIHRRLGADWLLAGVILVVVTVVNDFLNTQYILHTGHYRHLGIFMLTFSQSHVLSQRFSKAFTTIEKMSGELEKKNLELSRLNNIKDEFLANTSHELRTPLHGMIGLSESLKTGANGPVSDAQTQTLDLIVRIGKRLSGLINDILDFSKMKNGELKLNLTPVDVHSATNIVLSLSQTLSYKQSVNLVNQVPEQISPVLADENRLEQILLNLVDNGLKYTDKGEIIVGATENNGFVTISVSDTGIGIPEKDQDRIFESFEQGDGSRVKENKGVGLGLALTRKLVELQGGNIQVESEPGVGSTFNVMLPAFAKSGPTVEAPIFRSQVHDLPAIHPRPPVGEKLEHAPLILAVDDDPVNQQIIANFLNGESFTVHGISNGLQALDYIRTEKKPDMVLLDVMMPQISGFEVCQKIREIYSYYELPILFLSARNLITDITEGFSFGANDYLTKPFSKTELLTRIHSHLSSGKELEISTRRIRAMREFFGNFKKFENNRMLANAVMDFLTTQIETTYNSVFLDDNPLCSSFPDSGTIVEYLRDAIPDPNETIRLLDATRIRNLEGWWLVFRMKSIKNSLFVLYRSHNHPNFSRADIDFIKALVAESEQTRKQIDLLVRNEDNLKKYLYLRSRLPKICLIWAKGPTCKILYKGDRAFSTFEWSLKEIENHFSEESLFRIQRSFMINPKMEIRVVREPTTRDHVIHFLEPDTQEIVAGLLGDKKPSISRGKQKPCRERYPHWFH